jgi:hypothetical protein
MTDWIKEIRERLSMITEGDWFTYRDQSNYVGAFESHVDEPVAECFEDDDAYFIAHAPEDIKKLLAEVERLQTELTKVKDDKNLFRDLFIKKQLEE